MNITKQTVMALCRVPEELRVMVTVNGKELKLTREMISMA